MASTATTPSAPKAAVRVMGAICWNELHTRDAARAADFYAKVVGWTPRGAGASNCSGYTEWVAKSGHHHGGMMTMPAGVPAEAPANWAVYINVPDVDAAAARAVSLGGHVCTPPFDIPQVGRMCPIADPTGAVVHLFAGVGECGKRVPQDEPGSFCWQELLTTDTAAAERFYSQLLGWTTSRMPMPGGDYTLFWVAGANPESKTGCVGGMMKMTPDMGAMPSNWLSYIQVDDVDAAAGRVTDNGGKVCCPPTDIPNVGRFAVITDPTGATCALFTHK